MRSTTELPVDWDLVVAHSALVKNVAGNLLRTLPANSGVSHSDLMDAGMLGLIAASRRFDASLGYQFQTFAKRRVHGAMFDWLRQSMQHRGALSIDSNPAVSIVACPDEPDAEAQASHAWLWRLVKRLPERTQLVIALYYRDGMSDYQIAQQLALTQPRVFAIRKAALARLKRLGRQQPAEAR